VYSAVLLMYFIYAAVILLASLALIVQVSLSYNKTGRDSCRLKKICLASFRETCQWLEFPLNGLRAQRRLSPVVGLLPLASEMAS